MIRTAGDTSRIVTPAARYRDVRVLEFGIAGRLRIMTMITKSETVLLAMTGETVRRRLGLGGCIMCGS